MTLARSLPPSEVLSIQNEDRPAFLFPGGGRRGCHSRRQPRTESSAASDVGAERPREVFHSRISGLGSYRRQRLDFQQPQEQYFGAGSQDQSSRRGDYRGYEALLRLGD